MSVQRSQKNQYTHQGNDLVGFWSLTVNSCYAFCSVFCHLTELAFALDEKQIESQKKKQKQKNKQTKKDKLTKTKTNKGKEEWNRDKIVTEKGLNA